MTKMGLMMNLASFWTKSAAIVTGVIATLGIAGGAIDAAFAQAPDPKAGPPIDHVWNPAPTPKGGVSWKVLEATREDRRRDEQGYILSKPLFTPAVEKLDGKRIKVAGWMMPLENSATQKRFVLLGYPPGCPFHFHAGPNQFIEVLADTPFETDEVNAHVVSGVLELTGYDESGIFYRMKAARPG